MELKDYLRLADDGCPQCPEHVFYHDEPAEPADTFALFMPGMPSRLIVVVDMRFGIPDWVAAEYAAGRLKLSVNN